jgi:hypothetical protein
LPDCTNQFNPINTDLKPKSLSSVEERQPEVLTAYRTDKAEEMPEVANTCFCSNPIFDNTNKEYNIFLKYSIL